MENINIYCGIFNKEDILKINSDPNKKILVWRDNYKYDLFFKTFVKFIKQDTIIQNVTLSNRLSELFKNFDLNLKLINLSFLDLLLKKYTVIKSNENIDNNNSIINIDKNYTKLKLSCYILVTEPLKNNYPILECVESCSKIFDEIVIVAGRKEKDSEEILRKNPKVKYINTNKWPIVWDYSVMNYHFKVGLKNCTGDYAFKIDLYNH